MIKRLLIASAVGALAVMVAAVAAPAAHKVKGTTYYAAELQPIAGTAYEQDAQGTALLSLHGNRLHVVVHASGVVADETHVQHIHGFGKGTGKKRDATCPTIAQDSDGDGFVSVGEGAQTYGPILLPLDPFPTADAAGNVTYERTFKIKRGRLTPLVNREIVLHGGMQEGEYNPTLPVLCGAIAPDPQG